MQTIEDVILSGDRRGIKSLRPFLPDDYCGRAAWALHGASQRVLIATGFHVEQKCETDGPPGAIALAKAVRALGGDALIVSDGHAASVLADLDGRPCTSLEEYLAQPRASVIDFPRVDKEASDALTRRLLDVFNPTCVIAVERCGATDDGTYRNMRGEDIGHVTARLDPLFESGVTIGIGDGGNEIGMGSLAQHCVENGVTQWPCCTPALFPIVCAVSNWGAYGMCAALSLLADRNLLPDEKEASAILERIILLDGLDGVTRQKVPTVDGHSSEMNIDILRKLHAIVDSHLHP